MAQSWRSLQKGGILAILPFALAALGCGKEHHVAEVDGVLLLKGKPGHKVQIQFIPDIDKKTKGPMSVAETDSEGRFKLQLMEDNGSSRPGAIVGWHRVVLSDLQLAESATGAGVPVRFAAECTLPSTTPITQEVREGKQTIEIKVP